MAASLDVGQFVKSYMGTREAAQDVKDENILNKAYQQAASGQTQPQPTSPSGYTPMKQGVSAGTVPPKMEAPMYANMIKMAAQSGASARAIEGLMAKEREAKLTDLNNTVSYLKVKQDQLEDVGRLARGVSPEEGIPGLEKVLDSFQFNNPQMKQQMLQTLHGIKDFDQARNWISNLASTDNQQLQYQAKQMANQIRMLQEENRAYHQKAQEANWLNTAASRREAEEGRREDRAQREQDRKDQAEFRKQQAYDRDMNRIDSDYTRESTRISTSFAYPNEEARQKALDKLETDMQKRRDTIDKRYGIKGAPKQESVVGQDGIKYDRPEGMSDQDWKDYKAYITQGK